MTSSKSWNVHPSRRASVLPTVVLPAPMNPMRNTRRVRAARAIHHVFEILDRGVAAFYCFFTRILPLKDWSSTEDEPEREVPVKELPALVTNEVWDFVCRGKSFTTVPLTERAERSTEAVWGKVTSIAPLCVVKA